MNVRPFRAVLSVALTLILASPTVAATSANGIASLRAKAEAGNAIAQYNLGLVYADESEPAHDLIEAYLWLSRAASNGARGRQLDILTKRLTDAQIAKADRLLPAPEAPPTSTATAEPAPFTSVPLERVDPKTARIDAERRQLAQELSQVRGNLERLQTPDSGTVAELRKRVAIAETALDNRQSQVAGLQAQLDAEQAEGPSTRETELQRDRARLAAKANATPTELATQRTQTLQLRNQLDTLAQLRDAQSQSGNDASSEIADLQTSLQNSRDLATTGQNQISALVTERDALTAQLQTVDDQVSTLSTDLATARVSLIELRENQVAHIDEASTQVAKLQTELETLRTENTALTGQLESNTIAAADSAELLDQITILGGERDSLQVSLTTAQNQNSQLITELENERNTTDPAVLQAQTEIAELRSSLESAQSESSLLQTELAAQVSASPATVEVDPQLQNQHDASLRAFAVQEREIVRLREQFDDASARADAADATLGTLRDEVSGLQTAIAETEGRAAANAERAATAENAASSDTDSATALQTELTGAQNLAATQAAEIESLRAQLAPQPTEESPASDLSAQNITFREEARLAREQTASLSRELNVLRTRLALAQPSPLTPVPGRAPPSRPTAGPATIRYGAPAQAQTTRSAAADSVAIETAVTERASSPRATGPQRHTILSGETLSSIAGDFYGDGNRWPEIYRANREAIPDANRLRAGTPIVIP